MVSTEKYFLEFLCDEHMASFSGDRDLIEVHFRNEYIINAIRYQKFPVQYSNPIIIGISASTNSISKEIKFPSGLGIRTGIDPRLRNIPSSNLNAVLDLQGLKGSPSFSR